MSRTDRWQHLVERAFRLSETVSAGGAPAASRAEALALLDSVLEVFPVSIDPVEDFEGYAVRRLALALREALLAAALP
jgi:hypothetical protein